MADKPEIYLATLPNQEDIKARIGTSGDGATDNPTTLFSGIKGILSKFASIWTPARASKVDNLDTTISSRAPANTALSNGVWTNARAGNLDKLPDIEAHAIGASNHASAAETHAMNAYNKAVEAKASADNAASQAQAALSIVNDYDCTTGAMARLKLITTNTYNTATANPTRIDHMRLSNTARSSINGRGTVFLSLSANASSLAHEGYLVAIKINNGTVYYLDAGVGVAGNFIASINFTGKIEMKVEALKINNYVSVNYIGY